MSDQLRILEALGDELARATLADEQASARRPWWRPRGLPLLAVLAGLSVTGGAAAATHLFGLAAPVPAPRPGDAPPESRPIASTAALAGVPAADPDGQPAWDVRVSRSRTGELCTAVGQIVDGAFGIVGLDEKFRELPVGAADACGAAPVGSAVQVGARGAVGRGSMTARTLVVGIAGPKVTQVAIVKDGRAVPLALGRQRAFVAALTGLPDAIRPEIVVTSTSGRTRTIGLADSGRDETADSDPGRPAWTISTGNLVMKSSRRWVGFRPQPGGLQCVEGRQQTEPGGVAYDPANHRSPGQTPLACRPRSSTAPVVATLRRLVPQVDHEPNEWFFGLSPARTIAMGLVTDDVVRLELRTPEGARPVPITRKRSFLVLLDGRVDPTKLELRARLKDGSIATTRRENARMKTPNGHVFRTPVAPAWRDVAEVEKQLITADRPLAKTAGSDGTGPRVPDPAGGPAWAVHTWRATTTVERRGGEKVRRPVLCSAAGPLVDGVVRTPRGAGVGDGPAEATLYNGCVVTSAARIARQSPTDFPREFYVDPVVYVDDPSSQTPKIARVVISMVIPGVQRAEVLGLAKGRQLPATVGPDGSVLALLPSSTAEPGTNLRLRLHFPGGRVKTTDYTVFSTARRPIAARAVDPKGGPGWGVRGWNLREPSVPSMPGQAVDGRLGSISDRTGRVFFGSGTSYPFGGEGLDRRSPIWFTHQEQGGDPTGAGDGLSPADVARRTLPGRTVIYGVAAKGVTRVTIQTPRDVRTLRPSQVGGLFLAVYDGRFTQGRIRVTAKGPGILHSTERPADPIG